MYVYIHILALHLERSKLLLNFVKIITWICGNCMCYHLGFIFCISDKSNNLPATVNPKKCLNTWLSMYDGYQKPFK